MMSAGPAEDEPMAERRTPDDATLLDILIDGFEKCEHRCSIGASRLGHIGCSLPRDSVKPSGRRAAVLLG